MHQNKRKSPRTKDKALDQYYTKKEVVEVCLKKIAELPYSYDLVIEPSAGNGAFYKEIDHPNKIGIDIDPQHDDIEEGNWFEYRISKKYKKVLVVGNPPFGQYHKLSTAFIMHALSFSNVQTIAFILPNVYRKHTRQKIIPANWRIASIIELERNSFILEGEGYHVPASFFVFDRSNGIDLRVNPNLYIRTNDFEFSSRSDFDIFVFGASPKNVIRNPSDNNRGYFLKSSIPIEELVCKIKAIDWKGNSCANGGVYWLTKHEFLEQYIKRYEPERIKTNSEIHLEQLRSNQRGSEACLSG